MFFSGVSDDVVLFEEVLHNGGEEIGYVEEKRLDMWSRERMGKMGKMGKSQEKSREVKRAKSNQKSRSS